MPHNASFSITAPDMAYPAAPWPLRMAKAEETTSGRIRVSTHIAARNSHSSVRIGCLRHTPRPAPSSRGWRFHAAGGRHYRPEDLHAAVESRVGVSAGAMPGNPRPERLARRPLAGVEGMGRRCRPPRRQQGTSGQPFADTYPAAGPVEAIFRRWPANVDVRRAGTAPRCRLVAWTGRWTKRLVAWTKRGGRGLMVQAGIEPVQAADIEKTIDSIGYVQVV